MTGATNDEESVLRALLESFLSLPITREVAERAATNRRQKKIKLADAIILATAEVAKRQLATRNVKDFPAGMRGVSRFALCANAHISESRYGAPAPGDDEAVAKMGHPKLVEVKAAYLESSNML